MQAAITAASFLIPGGAFARAGMFVARAFRNVFSPVGRLIGRGIGAAIGGLGRAAGAIGGWATRAANAIGNQLVKSGAFSGSRRGFVRIDLPEVLARNMVYVYLGWRDGVVKYIGITNNLVRRGLEHRNRYRLEPLSKFPRLFGKGVEQALIEYFDLKNLDNKINSVSTKNRVYQMVIDYAKDWLNRNTDFKF